MTDAEIVGLLGAESLAAVTDWRKGVRPIPAEAVSRISDLTEMHRALQSLYPDKAVANAWLRQRSTKKLFGGTVALDLMLAGEDGVTRVLRYLATELTEQG